jgi:hypothetical protein
MQLSAKDVITKMKINILINSISKAITPSLLENIDKIVAIIGIIGSVSLSIYSLYIIKNPVFLVFSILILLSCIFWILNRDKEVNIIILKSQKISNILGMSFFLLFILCLSIIYYRNTIYECPIAFFFIISFMTGIVTSQIFYSNNRDIFILIQILIIGTLVSWYQYLIYPNLLGNDTWYHYFMTSQIINEFHIPSGLVYSFFPLFHILIANFSLLSGLDYKMSSLLSVSTGQIICGTLMVYLITKKLFKNSKIALLASLMLILANYQIFMSYAPIPNSYAAIFVYYLVFLVIYINETNNNTKIFITFFMMIPVILTHHLTSFWVSIMLFILIFGFFFSKILHRNQFNNPINFIVPIVFTMILYSWWAYGSNIFVLVDHLITTDLSAETFQTAPKLFSTYVLPVGIVERIFNFTGVFLSFSISFIGLFFMISKKGNLSTFSIALICITPLAVSFVSLISGHNILEARWWFFAQQFSCIPLSYGIISISSTYLKTEKSAIVLCSTIVALICFLMIMSPVANIANNQISPKSIMRATPIMSELSIIEFLDYYKGIIKTDSYYSRILKSLGYNTENLDNEIYSEDFSNKMKQLVLIRTYIQSNTFILFSALYQLEYSIINKCDNSLSLIYNNGEVRGYV